MASPQDLSTVTRLIVTFNSADVLEYSRIPAHELATLAVDNASIDDTPSKAQTLGYEVLNLGQNVGYANAIMAGLEKIETEFALIANPDVQISTKAVQALLDAAARNSDCSLFIPRIFKPDGSEFFRYETRFDPRVRDRVPPSTDQNVDTVSGAVLLVRRKPFIQYGGFDTNIFLYLKMMNFRCDFENSINPCALWLTPAPSILEMGLQEIPSRPTGSRTFPSAGRGAI